MIFNDIIKSKGLFIASTLILYFSEKFTIILIHKLNFTLLRKSLEATKKPFEKKKTLSLTTKRDFT